MEEEWRIIKNCPMYEVSNLGNIRSYYNGSHGIRTIPRRIALKTDRIGYTFVHLQNNSGRKPYRVHRLVAEAFIPNPNNLSEVNHKDENKQNNRIDNLEWCSRLYNVRYSKVWTSTERPVLQYDKEGNFIKEYNSMSEAARSNNTTPQSIFVSIKYGWYSANSKWKYKEAIKEKDSIKDNNNINN